MATIHNNTDYDYDLHDCTPLDVLRLHRTDDVSTNQINFRLLTSLTPAGASIPPETMMHFPPISDFPPIFEKFPDSEENFHNLTFPEKFLDFHPPKFLMTFF